jgi:hypothetical protein
MDIDAQLKQADKEVPALPLDLNTTDNSESFNTYVEEDDESPKQGLKVTSASITYVCTHYEQCYFTTH